MDHTGPAVAADVTDAAIIERSWQEPHCFAGVFDRHAPHLHRYLARRLGREAADDLTAETFLAAFRRRDRYDVRRADARPWLYGIATNLIGQHRRAEVRRYRRALATPPAEVEPCPADRVVADVTARASRASLGAALAGLAAAERDVLLLVAWEDLSYDEVAAALGVPVGTVRSRLNRARRKVREALGPDPTADSEEPT
ncbi:MAG TPA: RNA polymerase sigma factor [Pseudonocardiaceae bacterium]